MYGVVLLPPPPAHDLMVRYARAVVGRRPVSVLGAHALAHVTLAHLSCSEQVAWDWWRRVERTLPQVFDVHLGGVMVAPVPPGDPYVPQGGTYVGLEAVRRAGLDAAHRRVLEVTGGLRDRLAGAVADDFRPHVTLAVLRHGATVKLPPVPAGLLGGPLTMRLVCGRVERNGTFPG